jgi:hypothetical protein
MYDRLDVIRGHVAGWTVRDFERISMNFDNKILPSLNQLIQERFMLLITIHDRTTTRTRDPQRYPHEVGRNPQRDAVI